MRVAVARRTAEAERLARLRDDLIDRVRTAVPDVVLNGDPKDRLLKESLRESR